MPVSAEQDPRVYFAAERTFLAWIRTGLALMGVGFAVARFGLFLREMQPAVSAQPTGLSLWAGVTLVGIGIIITVKAALDHRRLIRDLNSGTWRAGRVSASALLLAGMLTLVGTAMAIYLIVIR